HFADDVEFIAVGNFIKGCRHAALHRVFDRYDGGVDFSCPDMVERGDNRAGGRRCCPASFGHPLQGGLSERAFWAQIRRCCRGGRSYGTVITGILGWRRIGSSPFSEISGFSARNQAPQPPATLNPE